VLKGQLWFRPKFRADEKGSPKQGNHAARGLPRGADIFRKSFGMNGKLLGHGLFLTSVLTLAGCQSGPSSTAGGYGSRPSYNTTSPAASGQASTYGTTGANPAARPMSTTPAGGMPAASTSPAFSGSSAGTGFGQGSSTSPYSTSMPSASSYTTNPPGTSAGTISRFPGADSPSPAPVPAVSGGSLPASPMPSAPQPYSVTPPTPPTGIGSGLQSP